MGRRKRRFLSGLAALVLSVAMVLSTALSVQAKTWGTTTQHASSTTVIVEVPGSYTTAEVDSWLQRLNQIRWEACQNGYICPGENRKLTTADYVPLTWDSSLEAIARIRSSEAEVRWTHTRPNDKRPFSIYCGETSSAGEILAWNRSMEDAIQAWYSEKNDYIYGGNGQTGHYKMMINPDYKSIGMSGFLGSSTTVNYYGREYSYGAYAGEFGRSSGDGKSIGEYGECVQLIEINQSRVQSISDISGVSSLGVGDEACFTVNCNFSYQESSSTNASWIPTTKNVRVYAANWKSSDTGVATVDEYGNVQAVGEGSCVISVQIGNYYASKNLKVSEVIMSCSPHVQTYGWKGTAYEGEIAGTVGESRRLESVKLNVSTKKDVGIIYTTHVQTYGWLPWVHDGELSGTEGESKRVEAIKMKLTGSDAGLYDLYYRVYVQGFGWLGWAKNGAAAGTAGYSYRMEAMQFTIVPKGKSAPGTTWNGVTSARVSCYVSKTEGASDGGSVTVAGENKTSVFYRTHVQSIGWQGWKYNGQMAGTVGMSKRLEGIQISLKNQEYSGGIIYRTHVQTYGWKPWVQNGTMSGTSGESKRLEAIEIKLTGEMAQKYDVYYRVQAQNVGWLGWAKNGQTAGTMGGSKRLESIQIVLVKKGDPAPSKSYGGYVQNNTKCYITFWN